MIVRVRFFTPCISSHQFTPSVCAAVVQYLYWAGPGKTENAMADPSDSRTGSARLRLGSDTHNA
jgi:hypothetical protein